MPGVLRVTTYNRAKALLVTLATAAALGAASSCSIGTSHTHGGQLLIVSTDLVPPNGSGGAQTATAAATVSFIVLGEPIDSSVTSTSSSPATISIKHGFDLSLPEAEVSAQHVAN
jgi:hypothetical protein